MSSVLKALKKLEEERRSGQTSSTAVTERYRSTTADHLLPVRRPWPLFAAGLVLGLLCAGGLFWLLRGPAAEQPVTAALPAPTASTAEPVRVAVPPRVATQPTSLRPAPPRKPAAVGTLPLATIPKQVASGAPDKAGFAGSRVSVAPAANPEAVIQQVQVERIEMPPPGQAWVAPPQLVVSEIFPAAGGERMAIVNDLPVMAGTVVEGAVVREIQADRVLFVIDGKNVVVPLPSKLPAARSDVQP